MQSYYASSESIQPLNEKLEQFERSLMPMAVVSCGRKRRVAIIGLSLFLLLGTVFGSLMLGGNKHETVVKESPVGLLQGEQLLNAVESYEKGMTQENAQPRLELML